MSRLDELALKLLDGECTQDEVSELEILTQSAEGRDQLVQLLQVEAHLQSASRRSVS